MYIYSTSNKLDIIRLKFHEYEFFAVFSNCSVIGILAATEFLPQKPKFRDHVLRLTVCSPGPTNGIRIDTRCPKELSYSFGVDSIASLES